MKRRTKKRGFSLVEILIALALFLIFAGSTAIFTQQAIQANKNSQYRTQAYAYIQEAQNAFMFKKKESWKNITGLTNAGGMHVIQTGNGYNIVPGSKTQNGFTQTITVTNIYRDGSDAIVASGGTADPDSRKITITVSWKDALNVTRSVSSSFIVSDWNVNKWAQSSASEFDLGTKQFVVTDTSTNSLKMENIAYPDWCLPKFSTTSLDLPGNGIANAITSVEGRSFIGTGTASPSATNPSFINVGITNTKPPIATVDGQFNNIKVNGVWGNGSYAFLATDNDSEEVQVLDLTTASPYTRVGYFNAPGTANATSVTTNAAGTVGYMTSSDNKLYVFDLAAKSGSRSQLGVKTLQGLGTKVKVIGNYAYVSISGSAAIELQIINISAPASMFTAGVGNTNQGDANDLYVNAAGTRAYVGTDSVASEKEFIVIDTSSKPGAVSQEYYQESGGQVVMEAEHYHANIARGGKSWNNNTSGSPASASGSYMEATPDSGTQIDTGYQKTSPELGFRVNFTTTGTYYVWVRGYSTGTSNNGVHIGYNGSNWPNSASMQTTNYNNWRWYKTTVSGTSSIDIPTPESYWINVWMQDDGFKLDRVLLTTSNSYTPGTTQVGPAETTRTTGVISVPAIARPVGEYESNGMSVKGVTVVENDTRALLVGTGAEEYQVVKLDDETTPARCAGLQIDSGINAIASVKEADTDSYSYLVTKETAAEFKIIRGGAGASQSQGGAFDEEYNTTGTFESQAFDTGSVQTVYNTLAWSAITPTGTTVKLQVRTGNSPAEITGNAYFGTDGTASTYFTDAVNSLIPATSAGERYIQFKIYFTSDGSHTATVNDVNITYE